MKPISSKTLKESTEMVAKCRECGCSPHVMLDRWCVCACHKQRDRFKPYYEHSGITIYHGHCREVAPRLGGSADFVCTDPPYSEHVHSEMIRDRSAFEGRSDPSPLPFEPIVDIKDLVSFISGLGSRWAAMFCTAEMSGAYQEAFGMHWRRTALWVKPDSAPQFSGDRPAANFECISLAWLGDGRSQWNGGGGRCVWTHNCTDYDRFHPTQKPLGLMSRLIVGFSNPGELLIDPYMGAGTTLVAAKLLGRRAIGIEIEEKYCEIAAKRLSQEVFDFGAKA